MGRNKINLLYVTWGMFIGGAELVVANLCKNINRELFDVCICYLKLDGPVGKDLRRRGIDVFTMPKPAFLDIKYLSFLSLASIIKEKKIDIIHSHDTASLVDSALTRIIARNVKLVHTFHFGNYPNLPGNNLLLEKCFWRVPDRLITVGNVQRAVIQKTLNIPDRRIATIWNGIDKRAQAVDDALIRMFARKEKVIIGSLSTLTEQKGLTYLLEAVAILRKRNNDFIVLVAGGGPLKDELETQSRKLGLQDAVYFLGWVENAAARVLPVFDIFIQPSLWEAMSMVLLEAMGIGKPVVATDVGENRYIIDDGKDGFLVKPKDIQGMAAALERLISAPVLRKKIGRAAQEKIETRYSASDMTACYERVYLEVLEKQPRHLLLNSAAQLKK